MCHDTEYMAKDKSNAEFWTLVSACKGKRYEDDSERWGKLLKLLGIPLREQGILSRMIGEGRFAKADNPQSYLAMATRRQAKNLNLYSDDRAKCELRGAKEEEVGPISQLSWAVKSKKSSGGPKFLEARSHDEFIEMADFHYGADGFHEDKLIEFVPEWMLVEGEDAELLEDLGFGKSIDWAKVAALSVSKPAMADLVGYVLACRYRGGQTRRMVMTGGCKSYRATQVQSAWKWIDRNWATRIVPLFHMRKQPRSLPVEKKESKPISPLEALNLAIKREQGINKSFFLS